MRYHLDLFSGIGGFALAAESVWPDIKHTFVEYEPFAQAVLKKHWPQAEIHGDIREFIANSKLARLEGQAGGSKEGLWGGLERCYLLTGGFPCQPFSQAGRRKGTNDNRFLWPQMLECIALFRPEWVIAENVAGLLTIEQGVVFERVCADMEAEGYAVSPFVIPACAVNAPHRRDRVWIVGHSQNSFGKRARGRGNGPKKGAGEWLEPEVQTTRPDSDAPNARRERPHEQQEQTIRHQQYSWQRNWVEVATRLCTLDDGLSNGLVRPKGWRNAALKAAGNAIVPQVATEIMKVISIL